MRRTRCIAQAFFDVLEEELGSLRKAETNTKNNYETLKRSLQGSTSAGTKASDEEKENKPRHRRRRRQLRVIWRCLAGAWQTPITPWRQPTEIACG